VILLAELMKSWQLFLKVCCKQHSFQLRMIRRSTSRPAFWLLLRATSGRLKRTHDPISRPAYIQLFLEPTGWQLVG
jgi:hypothetical protein